MLIAPRTTSSVPTRRASVGRRRVDRHLAKPPSSSDTSGLRPRGRHSSGARGTRWISRSAPGFPGGGSIQSSARRSGHANASSGVGPPLIFAPSTLTCPQPRTPSLVDGHHVIACRPLASRSSPPADPVPATSSSVRGSNVRPCSTFRCRSNPALPASPSAASNAVTPFPRCHACPDHDLHGASGPAGSRQASAEPPPHSSRAASSTASSHHRCQSSAGRGGRTRTARAICPPGRVYACPGILASPHPAPLGHASRSPTPRRPGWPAGSPSASRTVIARHAHLGRRVRRQHVTPSGPELATSTPATVGAPGGIRTHPRWAR